MDIIREFETNLAYYFSEVLEKPIAKPCWIYLSLSHKCTYSCQMCGVVKILKGHELRTTDVKRIFDEVSGWDWDFTIVITGGEPFLRNDIFDILKYAHDLDLNIEVVSNGSLITQDIAENIMSCGLSNIAISLDGAREETHDFIREKGAFKKAVQALRYLVAAKKKARGGPQISVWTTIMRENVRELFNIIPLVVDLGVECLVYHPVIVAQEDMQNTSPNARFWLKEADIHELKNQIDKIVDYRKNNGLVAFLHDPYLWIKHFQNQLSKSDWKCNPFVFTNIGPDGEVRSCGAAFGNINKLSFQECLNTADAHKARSVMKSCAKPCLQTCWANPQADCLDDIVDTLIRKIRDCSLDRESKKELLTNALRKLTHYEGMLKKCLL